MQGRFGEPEQIAAGKHCCAQRHNDEMLFMLAFIELDEEPSEQQCGARGKSRCDGAGQAGEQ